jgi:cytidylate kinase
MGLVVITGPPGAGKSTVARAVSARFSPSVLVEGDAFFAFLDQGAIAPWLPESGAQNEVIVNAAAAAAGRFAAHYQTIYDGVLGPWFLPAFTAATGLDSLHYVMLLPTVDECVRRVQTRVGHGFADEAATRKMHDEFSRAPVAERHVIRGDAGTAGDVAAEILTYVQDSSARYPLPA